MTDLELHQAIIDAVRQPRELARLVRGYYRDADRADRTSREMIYLHMGLMIGVLEQLAKRQPATAESHLAIEAALALADIPCRGYPTPEGWEERRLENTRTVRAARLALRTLR